MDVEVPRSGAERSCLLAPLLTDGIVHTRLDVARTPAAGSRQAAIVSTSALLCTRAASDPRQAGQEVTQKTREIR